MKRGDKEVESGRVESVEQLGGSRVECFISGRKRNGIFLSTVCCDGSWMNILCDVKVIDAVLDAVRLDR